MKANYRSYHVTRDGRVYNKYGKELSASDNGRGYLIVGITHNNRRTTKSIHRLVAEVYLPNPLGLSDVDHLDGDRYNNNLGNLRWLTHGQNIKHSYNLNNRSARGEGNARAILDEFDVHNICYLLECGVKPSRIRDMGFPYTPVRGVKARKNWLYISQDYSF